MRKVEGIDEYRVYPKLMNYSQKIIWKLYKYEGQEPSIELCPQYAHYLLNLDEEEIIIGSTFSRYWPVGGKEFYKVVDFDDEYFEDPKFSDLKNSYVKTNKLLIKIPELMFPIDETKMQKVSDKKAEELKQKVNKASLEDNVNNIVNSIFDLWAETEVNKERRTYVKNEIKKELIKMSTTNYRELEIQKVECHELYKAIKNEINRIRESSNYKNCCKSELKKIRHLTSFVRNFLENEKDFDIFEKKVQFEIFLKLQFEKILYENGGNSDGYSEFYTIRDIYDSNSCYYKKSQLLKYLELKEGDYIYIDRNHAINKILLNDMSMRPEKYLFVLDVPEENSIVPKETKEKIAEKAKQIRIETDGVSECER